MATVGSGEIRKLGQLDRNKGDGSCFDAFQVNCWKTLERNQTLLSTLIRSNNVLFVSVWHILQTELKQQKRNAVTIRYV